MLITNFRLGCFNLTLKGHGKCVEFMKRYNKNCLTIALQGSLFFI